MAGITIDMAPRATVINPTDKLPISQEDGQAKSITIYDLINYYAVSGGSPEAVNTLHVLTDAEYLALTQRITPVNLAGRSTDYLLAVGETAYLDFSGLTSAPLHIQMEQGFYEIDICGNGAGAGAPWDLLPNNTTYANIFRAPGSSPGTGNPSYFRFGSGGLRYGKLWISSSTTDKIMRSQVYGNTTIYQDTSNLYVWEDTTVWSSLGTIQAPFAHAHCTIVVRRLY